jgi:K+-sensing histidine kinase KdpD
MTAVIFVCTGFVISLLTSAARKQALAASHREAQTAALYSLTRALGATRGLEEILAVTTEHIRAHFVETWQFFCRQEQEKRNW